MKIVRFIHDSTTAYGILENDQRIEQILSPFDRCPQKTGQTFDLDQVRLLPPVAPPNVLAVGLNYRKHAEESNARIPDEPVLFLKASTSVIGPGDNIVLPAIAPAEVDYEAELVIVIGRTAKNVTEHDAPAFIAGYSCANDVSARDCQLRFDKQWARGKSFDTFCPLGPWIETDVDPDKLRIRSRVNGQVMQDSTTADMIFNTRVLVSFLSRCMTLLPGTVILTGTPSGVGFARTPAVFLKAGDVVEVEIEGIGVLKNSVVREAAVSR